MSQANIETGVKFDNGYAKELEGFCVPWNGGVVPSPEMVKLNITLAKALGFDLSRLSQSELAAVVTGATSPICATPIAQVYAGHQFGGFSEQLCYGRALLLADVVDDSGQRQDIQLKGSGASDIVARPVSYPS